MPNTTLLYLKRELEKVLAQSYDVKYPALSARNIFPIAPESGSGYTQITYKQFDQVGVAKLFNGNSKDIPVVNLKMKSFTSPVHHIVDAFTYDKFDLEKDMATNKSLDSRLTNAARRAALKEENDIAFQGDDDFNLPGLFSNSNIPNAVNATGIEGSTEIDDNKTAEEIVSDIVTLVNDVNDNTLGVELADSLAFPISTYNYLAGRTFGAAMPGMFILDALKKALPQIKNWYSCPELETAGVGSTKAMVAYTKNADNMALQIPVEFQQDAPEYANFTYTVNCRQDTGGLIVFYPLSVNIAYGI